MGTKDIENSIIYWCNQTFNTDEYNTPVDLIDGKLFKHLLGNLTLPNLPFSIFLFNNLNFLIIYTLSDIQMCIEGHVVIEGKEPLYSPLTDAFEGTIEILKLFYSDYPNIINDHRYKVILDEIYNEDQLVSITELVIGVLLKKAKSSAWTDNITNFVD